jgi:chromosomal replication initiator protein
MDTNTESSSQSFPQNAQELSTIWQHVLNDLKKEVSQGNFIAFLKPTNLASLDDGIATITAPSVMILNLLEKRFSTTIKTLLDTYTKQDVALFFSVKATAVDHSQELKDAPLFSGAQTQSPLVTGAEIGTTGQPTLSVGHLPRVRSDYTFSNFAVSGSNQVAFVAASTVAANIGKAYNPLFLYGPVGVGKTHLMHAIANEIYHKQPDKKIIYITSEEFTNEVVEAIRNNDTGKMKRRFRSAYILLIDDIQFIEGKDRVQEELFHTFNILIDQGSQIALSSDRPPQEIKKLEKRLSSRFAGGLTVDIEKPDFELKTAILKKKAEKFGHEMPMDVAMLLANSAEDTRTLEGLLLRLITLATTQNSLITIDLAQKALGKEVEEARGHLHAEDVIKTVCDFYQIKPTLLRGPKRDASLARARQVAMYLLKIELNLTHMEIGHMLGGRDHTTVMHGVEKIRKLVDNKDKIYEDISGITRTLRG